MRLCCKVPGEGMDDFSFLSSEGLFVQLLKGRIEGEFDPDRAEKNKWYNADFPKNTTYFLKVFEEGGGMTKTGKSKIISDINGEKIKPYQIFTTGHLSNAKHAEFHCKECIEITSSKRGSINIQYQQVTFSKDFVGTAFLNIWKGNKKEFPLTFIRYKKAAEAAYLKANDYHCRVPYYVIKGEDR